MSYAEGRYRNIDPFIPNSPKFKICFRLNQSLHHGKEPAERFYLNVGIMDFIRKIHSKVEMASHLTKIHSR